MVNIIGLLDARGAEIAVYTYDAWGNVIASTGTDSGIGAVNPLLYRGYYYDSELGMYYLRSRYYDPGVKRFINADDIEILFKNQQNILENNLCIYCFNNSVNCEDSSGYAATMMIRMGVKSALLGSGTSLRPPRGHTTGAFARE